MDFLIDKKIQAAIQPFIDKITFLQDQVKTLTEELQSLRKEQMESNVETKEHLKMINEEVSAIKLVNEKSIAHPVDKAGTHKKEAIAPKNIKKAEVHNVPNNHAPKELKKQIVSPMKTNKGSKKVQPQPPKIQIKPSAEMIKISEETNLQINGQAPKNSQINSKTVEEQKNMKGNELKLSEDQMNNKTNQILQQSKTKIDQFHISNSQEKPELPLIDSFAEQKQNETEQIASRSEIKTIQKLKTQTEELSVNLMEEDQILLLQQDQQYEQIEQPFKHQIKMQFISQNIACLEQQKQRSKQQTQQIKIDNLNLTSSPEHPQKPEKHSNIKQKQANSPKLTEREKAKKQTPVIQKSGTGSGTKRQNGKPLKTMESQSKNNKSVIVNKQKTESTKGAKAVSKTTKETNPKSKQIPKSVENSIKKEVHEKNGVISSQKKSNQNEKTKKPIHLNQQCQQKVPTPAKQFKIGSWQSNNENGMLLKIRVAEKLSENILLLYNKMSEMVKMLPEDLDQMSYKQLKIYHQLGINISKSVDTNQILIQIGQINKMISSGEETLYSRNMISKVINMIAILMNIVHGIVSLEENQSKQTQQQRVSNNLRINYKKFQNLMKQIELQALKIFLSDISMMKFTGQGIKIEQYICQNMIKTCQECHQLSNNQQIMHKNGIIEG